MITVKLAVLGNGSVDFNMDEETTLGDLLEMANANTHLEFLIRGEKVTGDTVLQNGDTVIGTQDVKGGAR